MASAQINLQLSVEEAQVLRILLFCTQHGLTGNGKLVSSIAGALDSAGVTISDELDRAICNGEIVQKKSVDTGIYFV